MKAPLDLLYKVTPSMVIDLDPQKSQLCLDPRLDITVGFLLVNEVSLQLEELPQLPEQDTAAWYHILDGPLPEIGDQVLRKIPCTSMEDIQHELLSLWLPRWQLPAHIPDELWERITSFAHAYMPRGRLECPEINGNMLLRTLSSGNGLRTRGLDAWAKTDLKSLPDCFRDELANMYRNIEEGAPWPMQIVRGHVTCLEKIDGAEIASQFRPVVLFGLPYRLWSSLRSRMLIPQITKMVNFPAFGYLSGRSSTQVAFQVQALMESAISTSETLVGVTTDIEKCFNFLQRKPVMLLASLLGIQTSVLTAWQAFLTQMTRAFVVQQMVGKDYTSSNGFPEGDSLSCIALLVMSFALHLYMNAQWSMARDCSMPP